MFPPAPPKVMEGASPPLRGRSPRRGHPASPQHSRDSSPNWSDVSDHSPPRLLALPQARPSLDSPLEDAPLARPGGRRSPLRGGGAPRPRGRQPKGQRDHFFRHTTLTEETAAARLEVACLVMQVAAAVTALVQGVCMAVVAGVWRRRGADGGVCVLYVHVPPGLGVYWGNEDLTPCKAAAFLPLLVAALALTLAAAHCCLLHVWRTAGRAPAATASRVYGGVTLALVALEAVLALTAALVLTEGFRQTCISFDLSLSWNEAPHTCRSNLDDRDDASQVSGTFPKLLAGLVAGWASVALTAALTVTCAVRARLCSCCRLLCV